MTEKKKKPEATKKASTTQRYSDVAKELGIEVKALLALADQFVEAHPDYKDYVYTDGKKPAASSNFSKLIRDDFLKFAADKLPKKEEPAPAPEPVTLDLRGTFVGPDAAADAATTAALCSELADEVEWDARQPEPLIKSGVAFDELRTRTRLLLVRGESLGEKHPRARAAIEAYLNANAGTSGGPLTPEGKAKWVAAYREVAKAAEAAAR